MDETRRVDLSEDPSLNEYEPTPISPYDASDDDFLVEDDAIVDQASGDGRSEELERWFERGEARVFRRGIGEPYVGPQSFFEDVLDRDDVTAEDLIELHDEFESERSTQNSIFDLFANLSFMSDLDPSPTDRSDPNHPAHLHVFQSEDDDGVPQNTWVHSRDIRVIEIPTRLWELHELSAKAKLEAMDNAAKPKQRKASKSRL